MGLQDYTAFGSITQCTKHLLKRVPAPEIVQRNSTLESTGVVALTPEGVPTNGKALLKFAEWPFELGECVQPAVIGTKVICFIIYFPKIMFYYIL